MKIDAHQHFWQLSRGDYEWLTPDLAPLYRDFMPADLAPFLKEAGIDGTILVQAAPTQAETKFMLRIAQDNDFILGVVGWVDFNAANAPDLIADLAKNPKLVGLRPMIQDISDDAWVLSPNIKPAFEAMIAHDLTFDALTLPRHLPNLQKLLARHPELKVVIDHCSKPAIRDNLIDDWAKHMATLARDTSAFCKLSGLVTEARADWSVTDLQPYVDHLLDCFGPFRLIWGSDWPVCTLASDYSRWHDASYTLLQSCTATEIGLIFGGTAQHVYPAISGAAG